LYNRIGSVRPSPKKHFQKHALRGFCAEFSRLSVSSPAALKPSYVSVLQIQRSFHFQHAPPASKEKKYSNLSNFNLILFPLGMIPQEEKKEVVPEMATYNSSTF